MVCLCHYKGTFKKNSWKIVVNKFIFSHNITQKVKFLALLDSLRTKKHIYFKFFCLNLDDFVFSVSKKSLRISLEDISHQNCHQLH